VYWIPRSGRAIKGNSISRHRPSMNLSSQYVSYRALVFSSFARISSLYQWRLCGPQIDPHDLRLTSENRDVLQ